MKFINAKSLLLLILFLPYSVEVFTQKSSHYTHPDYKFNDAMALYNKQKYGAAQIQFNDYLQLQPNVKSETRTNAELYSALCAIKLINKDAEYQVFQFKSDHPESPKVNDLEFELARYFFQNKKNNGVVKTLENVDPYLLNDDEQAEYYFMLGYSLFMKNKKDKARVAFYKIVDINTPYTSPATYYYSHINYTQGNYQTALKGFYRLEDDEIFSSIVPYYISQILFTQEKYHEIIEYAPPLLDELAESRKAEMSKIIGLSYYRTDNFEDALPYLEEFSEKTSTMTREDWYQLAYTYYMTQNYEKAADAFENVSYGNNALSQNALYHLAECYLKLDRKKDAGIAFRGAAKLDFNLKIKEDALFHYALVTHELSFSPFNEAIKAFNEYLEEFPRSKRTDEVYHYLTLVYLNTKNYKAALDLLNKIKHKNDDIRRAEQKIALYRGLELYNNLEFNESISLFNTSLDNAQYNNTYEALAHYWKGEAYYRLREMESAIEQYNSFLALPHSKKLPEYITCHYNLAYTYFSKKEYNKAITWFQRFEVNSTKVKSDLICDTYNRIADCYFILANYNKAIEYYNKNIQAKKLDVDYALYQKGLSLGLLKQHNDKVIVLNTLLTQHPKSSYYDDALFELGKTYTIINKEAEAIKSYQTILNNHKTSSFYSKALIQLGLIYYNKGDNEQALASYKKVVEGFPGTEEAENALTGIRNIYVDMNDIDAYFVYVESLGTIQSVSIAEQDSLSYITAENIYMSGDCEKSKNSFINYIERFKDGRFLLNAHYYKGDCQYKAEEYDNALESFNYVIERPKNIFSESSLLGASSIYYQMTDYENALQNYQQLEQVAEIKSNIQMAITGQMRCHYELGNYKEAIDAAYNLLEIKKLSETTRREARYIAGKSSYELRDYEVAKDNFVIASKEVSTEQGAEAKYLLAEITQTMGHLTAALTIIYEFIEMGTPHEYWLARAYILMAEIFAETGDEFQAVYCLQSIIEDYGREDDGIIQMAKSKRLLIINHMKERGIEIDENNLNIVVE